MIQHQQWYTEKRILIVDENKHGTVQISIPGNVEEDSKIYESADALIYALWVDKPYRRQGVAKKLLESAEREAKRMGCRKVALEWDRRESKEWTLQWYERLGYVEKSFGRYSCLLTKKL